MDVLIVEDERISRQHLQRQLERWGHTVVAASDGSEAWDILRSREISLIISDWQMPGMSGPDLVRRIRQELTSRYVYVILLTARSNPQDLIDGMEAGADDFLTKPFNAGELRVRLRAGARVVELERALAEKNAQMQADLEAASRFARSQLPQPLSRPWTVAYEYHPMSVVSGDALGYHWIDERYFATYVLDVTGHGLDAALLATTLLNVIRSGSLPAIDFRNPGQVVTSLNHTFPMESVGEKCFTIWYGVIDHLTRELRWAGGGHPPAVLVPGGLPGNPSLLRSTGPPLGALEWDFGTKSIMLPLDGTLFVYSDGAHELRTKADLWPHAEFVQLLTMAAEKQRSLTAIMEQLRLINGGPRFEDDVSLVRIEFQSHPLP